MAKLISVKITEESKEHTKLIAAKRNEKFYEAYAKIAKQAAKRLKLA